MNGPSEEQLSRLLAELYGQTASQNLLRQVRSRIESFRPVMETGLWRVTGSPSHRDVLLITYPDQVTQPGQPPLQTLADFAEQAVPKGVSAMHVLPFYPASSDDGFAVVDYTAVDPGLGGWEDVSRLARRYRLMVDAVINHISSASPWLRGYLEGDERYRGCFIEVPEGADLSQVVRPRTLPLVTSFAGAQGEVRLWTTFSADQVDLNYHNPQVLLDVLDAVLLYVERGAQWIRLDAIAYLWKEIGTPCIHLPQTHAVVQLLRAVFDQAAPDVQLITETNVPHHENLSYFGDGHDEAQMVYNFALPPLVLHTLLTGRAGSLSAWASSLSLPSGEVTFLNFLASHDGIGLNPVRGILSTAEIDALTAAVLRHGGLVSSKTNPDGSDSPYELNISYFDALSDPQARETLETQVDRFMVAQAILCCLVGVPGIYFHSLFGSRSWKEGVQQTGRSRTINRQKFTRAELEAELSNPDSLRARVLARYTHLLEARGSMPAFDPYGQQLILNAGDAIFGVLRVPPAGEKPVICLHNVSDQAQPVELNMDALGYEPRMWNDLISGQAFVLGRHPNLLLEPYQYVWLA